MSKDIAANNWHYITESTDKSVEKPKSKQVIINPERVKLETPKPVNTKPPVSTSVNLKPPAPKNEYKTIHKPIVKPPTISSPRLPQNVQTSFSSSHVEDHDRRWNWIPSTCSC